MRYLCLLAVLLTLPVSATAQPFDSAQGGQRRGDDRRSNDRSSGDRGSDQRQSDRQSSPQSNPRTPWWEQQQTPWWERQGKPAWEQPQVPAWQTMNPARTLLDREREERQRQDTIGGSNHRQFRRNTAPNVIVVPQYPYFPNTLPQYVVTPPPPAPIVTRQVVPEPPRAPTGILRLDVEPRELLQIYVDGVFVGTPEDLGDELTLTPGTRRIEIRARGYKTLSFSAEIQENRSISYRGSLERDETAPPKEPSTPAVVRPPDTPGATRMYMIPGCYLGNVAPKAEQLRPSCDISKLTIFTP